MDYSDYGFTFLASSAPPYPTDVSELSDMNLVYSGSNFISTPSASVSKSASPIFAFNNSPPALVTPREAKAPSDTIAHRDMSQDIYLIDSSSAPHSSTAVTIEAKASSVTCLPHPAIPQSIYLIDFPPSALDNHTIVATTPSEAKAPPNISFSRRSMSGPAQVTDITPSIIDFYNSATTTSTLAGGTTFGPAQSAECLTSPIVALHKPIAITTTPEIETPYTTFSFPTESRPAQVTDITTTTTTAPIFTPYNHTAITTNVIHGLDQSTEFIAFPTFAPYNPGAITTPLTYRTISSPPQVKEIIASPVFTFYNPAAVGDTSANFQALSAATSTISSSPQIITLNRVCDAEDETMECDNESGKEENKGGKNEIMRRNYGDRVIEGEHSKVEEDTECEGEDKMIVEDTRTEEEDKIIEDEDRNIEEVDGGDDSEEEIDQGEIESEESEEESEESEQENEDSEGESEEEGEESEEESEGSEDENKEEGEESEEEIEESEDEDEEREQDNNIKGENKYNEFEAEEVVVGERNSKVEDSGVEDLVIENRKDGDGEAKNSNFEYSGIEDGNRGEEVNESEEGRSKIGETEPITEGSKAGGGDKSEDGSGGESSEGKKEIAEGEEKGDDTVEAEAAQQYQVEVGDEEIEESEIATVAQLATRKIAPLRRRFPNILAVSTPTPIRGGEEELEQEWKSFNGNRDSDESLSDPESDSGDEALGWAGNVAVAERKSEKAIGAFELSEMAVEVPFNGLVVPVPASTPTYTLTSASRESSCESLSEPESDEGDEALGWALPESEEEHGEEKEKITPTSASTLNSSVRAATIWKPSSAFVSNRAFAPASIAHSPRSPPVIITGTWVRERRGSRKEWTWVAEDSTAGPQQDIKIDEDEKEVKEDMAVKTEEEEDALRAEIFRADMARVRGRGWSWGEVLVEEAITTTAATAPESTDVDTVDTLSVEDGSSSNSPTEPGLITMPTGRWTVPIWPLLLVFVAITLVAWILRVWQSLTGNVLWDGVWIDPGTPAWEFIAPLETVLLKIGWQLFPVNVGTTALTLFLSVVLADICAVARGRAVIGSSSSLFGWTAGAASGAVAVSRGVMRWRGALAMTTTEGSVVFTSPEVVTGTEWEGVKASSGYEEYLPIEFVSAGDTAPTCPRHELGIGAGTGGLGSGAGTSFGLGLFLLGFLVWGSGGRQLRRSAGGV